MPTWKPSRLRSWLFSGSGWIFNSDGDAFELSLDRGRRVVKGPLILIHSLECKPRHNFSTTLECHFHIIGTGWVVGEGLGEDKAEELQQFVREEVTGSLIWPPENGRHEAVSGGSPELPGVVVRRVVAQRRV